MIQKLQRDLLWQPRTTPPPDSPTARPSPPAIRRNWLRIETRMLLRVGVTPLDNSNPAVYAAGRKPTPLLREFAGCCPLPAADALFRVPVNPHCVLVGSRRQRSPPWRKRCPAASHFRPPQEIDGTRYACRPRPDDVDARLPQSGSVYDNAHAASAEPRVRASQSSYDSEADAAGVLARAEWAHELTAILANNQLSLNCQPVAAAADSAGTPLYYEVLLHPAAHGERTIATRDLIAVAERLQRITEIDRWVVKTVLQWMRDHADLAARIGGFSINLSGQSVTNPLFLKFLLAELARGDIAGDKLIFEISEADAVDGHAQTQLFMRQLQRHGCRFTLDDFGVGTSSYTRLKSMKLDYLKLDRALVREIGTSMIDEALVRSILETGSFLGIRTVAGYVEDAETLAKLAEMGVDCVQGYLIGEPRPLEGLA